MATENKIIQIILKAKDEASGILSSIGSKLSGFVDAAKVAFFAVAAAAVAATAAIAGVVKQTLDFGDDIGKAADRVGTTTEALIGLRYAADLSGISAEELEKQIIKLNKSIGEAATGSKAQVEAFTALGLSAKELAAQSPDKAFIAVVGALEKVSNQSEKTRLALDIFGKAGASVFNLTAKGLQDATKEAEDFGLTFSRIDAQRMEEVNDSVTRVTTILQGVGVQLTLALLKPLEELSKTIVGLAKDGTLKDWATKIGESVGTAITWLDGLLKNTNDLQATWQIFTSFWQGLVGTFTTIGNSLALALVTPIEAALTVLNSLTFGKVGFIADATTAVEEFRKTAQAALGGGIRDLADGVSGVAEGIGKLADPTKNATTEVKKLGTETASASEATKLAAKTDAQAAVDKKALAEASKKAADELEKQKIEATKLVIEMEKLASNERIRKIELAVGLNVEKLKSETEIAKQIIGSLDTSIKSTGELLSSLFGSLLEASQRGGWSTQRLIEDQIKLENDRRREALELQKQLTQAQIEMINARVDSIRNGRGLINVQLELKIILN